MTNYNNGALLFSAGQTSFGVVGLPSSGRGTHGKSHPEFLLRHRLIALPQVFAVKLAAVGRESRGCAIWVARVSFDVRSTTARRLKSECRTRITGDRANGIV